MGNVVMATRLGRMYVNEVDLWSTIDINLLRSLKTYSIQRPDLNH